MRTTIETDERFGEYSMQKRQRLLTEAKEISAQICFRNMLRKYPISCNSAFDVYT